jgi:hypothetical protein
MKKCVAARDMSGSGTACSSPRLPLELAWLRSALACAHYRVLDSRQCACTAPRLRCDCSLPCEAAGCSRIHFPLLAERVPFHVSSQNEFKKISQVLRADARRDPPMRRSPAGGEPREQPFDSYRTAKLQRRKSEAFGVVFYTPRFRARDLAKRDEAQGGQQGGKDTKCLTPDLCESSLQTLSCLPFFLGCVCL